MTSDNAKTSGGRLGRLLSLDPTAAGARPERGRGPLLLRSILFRLLGPYARHQRMLAEQMARAVEEHDVALNRLAAAIREREDRLDRLETYVSDMTSAVEALRQRILAAEGRGHAAQELARKSAEG